MKADYTEYAKALFSVAQEKGCEEKINTELSMIKSVLDGTEDIYLFLSSPDIPKKNRTDILISAFSESVSEDTLSFLSVLCENGDSALLPECAGEFDRLYSKSLNVSRAVVTSTFELSSEQKNALTQRLSKKLNKKIETEYIIDLSLIGGLRVEIDGVVFDGSLKKRLMSLKEVMEE